MADLPDRGVKEPSAVGGCIVGVFVWVFFIFVGAYIGRLVVKFLPYLIFSFVPPLRDRLVVNDSDSSMVMREVVGAVLGGVVALRFLFMARKEGRRRKRWDDGEM